MIKAEYTPPIQKEFSFPCILIEKEDENIVLFTAHRIGTVLSSKHKNLPIGFFSKSWGMDDFKPLSGPIKLKNI